MSGVIIERRDQVLIIRLSLVAVATATFFSTCVSTHGPFFNDLAIFLMLPARPLAHDIAIRRLFLARFVTLGRLSPRRLRMIPFRASLAAAMRMIDRIHRDAAHVSALAEPARATGLA